MTEKLIRITSGYFVCGIVCRDGIVVRAAPIVKYMKGWNGKRFVEYCNKKKFEFEVIN
jgi:hypothetical protein